MKDLIPSRYGLSHYLTTATNCLLAKMRGMLMPDKKNEAAELRLVPMWPPRPSVHRSCLVFMRFQLMQLLTCSDGAIWSHHTLGSINLIKHRTPRRFDSDFDKALFVAHIGPIVFDCLLDHRPCYLAEPQWMEIYHSLVCDLNTLTERSLLATSMRSQMIKLPDLWHDLNRTIRGSDLFNEEGQVSLLFRCFNARQQFLDWIEEYQSYCTRMSPVSPSPQELALRRELYGTAIECLIVVKRLLETIIYTDESLAIEAEVQALAQSLLDLQKQPSPKHSWLFMGHEMGVTRSVLLTRHQWESPM
ncbi:uncharacterized protein TRUGW13939_08869 [Talaromyces rugulosus]|uniref:Transcription factor domain-containing protein n=1 Tax=Talaromyces rugulosus TaxID=121627 RepID=A0A7H8R5Q3_TALRU|nr:uncharacterized protein TRUGW13939_08869 [Talaromyces rugulosus]QKX61714.1 hypothetical protein TRUGW13939_08869 [Talaromyces rugulosus]